MLLPNRTGRIWHMTALYVGTFAHPPASSPLPLQIDRGVGPVELTSGSSSMCGLITSAKLASSVADFLNDVWTIHSRPAEGAMTPTDLAQSGLWIIAEYNEA
jgi:hypothetical protein